MKYLERPFLIKSKILLFIVGCLVLCIGIYNAWWESVHLGFMDSDDTDTLMIWYGFKQHGWNFIKTWLYTEDNWLLSLLPFHALMFSFFNFSPKLIVLSGLIVFLLNVLLCSLIARAIGAKKSALLVPLLLLYAGDFFYRYSNITYPITHNSTHFFGLLTLFFSIWWIQRRYWLSLVMVFVAIIVGGLSDPWFFASFSLPLIFAALMIRNDYLLMTILASTILGATHLLGWFSFLGGTAFHLANWQQFSANFLYVVNNLGLFINFFPNHSHWAAWGSLLILLYLTGLVIVKLKRSSLPAPDQCFFFLSVAFSIGILTICFLWYAKPEPRYLLNLFILSILVLSVGIELNWNSLSLGIKVAAILMTIMYIISGLSTHAPLGKGLPSPLPSEHDRLLAVLAKQGWSYGYANYWDASILTALSQDRIRVRPIAFSQKNGFMYWDKRKQTSPFWYLPTDIPFGQKKFFVYWHKGKDMRFYQRALIRQYGHPIQTLLYQDGIIMVWSHSLKVGVEKDILPSWEKRIPIEVISMFV